MVIKREYLVQVRVKGLNSSSAKWCSYYGRRFDKYPIECKTLTQARRSFNYYNGRNVANVLYGGYDSKSGTFEARIVKIETTQSVVR